MIKNKQTFSIRESVEILVPDNLSRINYLLAIFLILVMLGIITALLYKLPIVIPLYFTLPWGESRLAPRIMLYSLPVITLLFTICNLALGRMSLKLSPLLPKVLAVATSIIAAMMMISLLGVLQSLIL